MSERKEILNKLEDQWKVISRMDKNLAIVKTNIERINGTIARHEKKNNEQDDKINNLSKSVSGIKSKIAVIGGISAIILTGIISLIVKTISQ